MDAKDAKENIAPFASFALFGYSRKKPEYLLILQENIEFYRATVISQLPI
jgi:hypothetical protein